MLIWRRWLTALVLVMVAFAYFTPGQTALAQTEPRLRIMQVDASAFPDVRLTVMATDNQGFPLPDLSSLSLSEDGTAVTDFAAQPLPVGLDLVLVIDANRDISRIDEAGGISRLAKVKESISRFANTFMSRSQLDHVQVIAPEGGAGRFLVEDSEVVFYTSVINAMTSYNPSSFADTPLQAMMVSAMQYAGQSAGQGRFQAIVLFTDGARIGDQLDFASLVADAQAKGITIYVVILGARADANEIENAAQLFDPTGGTYVHMPQANATDGLYTALQGNGSQVQLAYRSQADSSGQHILNATLGSATATLSFELTVQPPAVEIALDNSQPIRRVAAATDTPLAEMEPASQPVIAQVSWPDEHPRLLTAAVLRVNGEEQPLAETPVLDDNGRLAFEWGIAELDEGIYELEVEITDELGLVSTSAPLPLVIAVERPGGDVPPAGEPSTPDDSQPAASGKIPAESGLMSRLGLLGVAVGAAAILFALTVLIAAVVLIRRRRPPLAQSSDVSKPSELSSPLVAPHDATQVILPHFAQAKQAKAFLEAVENAPEYRAPVPVSSGNVAIGRDPHLAQIILQDKSVSRLHARIMESNGVFRLYDEGSASGTYLNYERVTLTPQVLKDTDIIHFGRVQVRFNLPPLSQEKDSTQIMVAPPRREGRPPLQPQPETDDVGTLPYMPNQPPPAAPGRQKITSLPPKVSTAVDTSPAGDDSQDNPDDTSTQPYMPHSPRK